ncbi:HTH-type transcriptional regulator DmlR [Pseudomonas fluorescens]|uniref:HTH-type transcriptional regulator DmlR n=2 Tax=Pseudomonas fluorescens TaxID=294 RepID=A0A5E7RXW8_PSEFL|nr:LysR family transcriptional regulator [Pseudomonas fluorescens]VVP79176.1 HTH-type transcriptional regulator DmlR [Pseudomonas fluorescens]
MFSSERLKGIDVFVCVSEFGSFTAAAEQLNLTASAVSKSIARLEKRLGVRLFQRTTRRLSLTDAGVAFHRTCTGVLADLEEAELSLQAENTEPRGRVRIDLPGAYGRVQVMPILLQWMQDHPLLIPHLSFSDGFIDPLKEGVDIVVRIGGAQAWPETVGHRLLARERHTFCASPSYLARHGIPLSESDLEHHPCIAYGWVDGSISPWSFAGEQGATLRRQITPRLVVGNGDALMMAALAGLGIAQLPSWLIKQQLQEGKLVEVLPQLATEGMSINLAWIKSRQALPKVRLLLEALIAGLTSLDGSSR